MSPAAKERMQKSEEKLTKVSDSVEASQRQLSESRSYGCFYVFFMCKCFLKIPWWQSSFILVLNGLGRLSLSNFFLQYSIQLISRKLMWWHMENDDILYYDLILPVMFEGCCDLFETWCMTFMLKTFSDTLEVGAFLVSIQGSTFSTSWWTYTTCCNAAWVKQLQVIFASFNKNMKIHRVVERTRGGTVDVRLTAHVNNSMQPVEGSTAAIRDDLRQVYAAWRWTRIHGLVLYKVDCACSSLRIHVCWFFIFFWCLKQFKYFDSSGHKIFQTPHAACRNFPRADCWGSTWIWHQRSPEWDW